MELEQMENNQNTYRVNPAITIVIILQLIFIIFAGITIHNALNHNAGTPKIKINNYSAIPNGKIISKNSTISNTKVIDFTLNDTAKEVIESTIYNAASANNDGNIANHGAKIREGSAYYAYIESLNGYFLHFITDIEDLGQSYHFVWLFNNDSSSQEDPKIEFLMAFCPKEVEMIYDNSNCKDDYAGHGLDIVAYNLIRYHSFNNFSTEMTNVYENNPLEITIQLFPRKESSEDVAIQELSEYLSGLGIDVDNFERQFVRLNYAPLPDSQKTAR